MPPVKVTSSMARSQPAENIYYHWRIYNVGSTINYCSTAAEIAQWGAPSCSRLQPATDNGVRDGRSCMIGRYSHITQSSTPWDPRNARCKWGPETPCETRCSHLDANARPPEARQTHCLCGHSGYKRPSQDSQVARLLRRPQWPASLWRRWPPSSWRKWPVSSWCKWPASSWCKWPASSWRKWPVSSWCKRPDPPYTSRLIMSPKRLPYWGRSEAPQQMLRAYTKEAIVHWAAILRRSLALDASSWASSVSCDVSRNSGLKKTGYYQENYEQMCNKGLMHVTLRCTSNMQDLTATTYLALIIITGNCKFNLI